VYAPASGEVVAVNDELSGAPEKVNEDAEGAGWFVKLKLSDKSQLDALMDEAAYNAFLKDLG
jgi:glycine cleavage system H protein